MYPGKAAAQELHIALLQAPQQAEGQVPLPLFFQPGPFFRREETPDQGRVIGAQLLGMDSGILRLPLTEISEENRGRLRAVLRDQGMNV